MKNLNSKKILKYAIIIVLILGLVAGISVGAFYGSLSVNPKNFQKEIEDSGVFKNDFSNKLPQTAIYEVMYKHFFENETGKKPKLLFVGYDGCVANAVPLQKDYENSALFRVAETGGIYLGYCGGENPGDQATSTAPGWASAFTGVWASEHGVKDNSDTLKEDYRTVLYEIASAGIPTSYAVTWGPHIEVTYKREVASVKANNFPLSYVLSKKDSETFLDMRNRIVTGDTDAIFGILEYTDSMGHRKGFKASKKSYKEAVNKAEDDAYALINAIEARATYGSEDWLIILKSDHGGNFFHHGKTTIMESTIFFASNKKIFG